MPSTPARMISSTTSGTLKRFTTLTAGNLFSLKTVLSRLASLI
jgi:hypothetical protein